MDLWPKPNKTMRNNSRVLLKPKYLTFPLKSYFFKILSLEQPWEMELTDWFYFNIRKMLDNSLLINSTNQQVVKEVLPML